MPRRSSKSPEPSTIASGRTWFGGLLAVYNLGFPEVRMNVSSSTAGYSLKCTIQVLKTKQAPQPLQFYFGHGVLLHLSVIAARVYTLSTCSSIGVWGHLICILDIDQESKRDASVYESVTEMVRYLPTGDPLNLTSRKGDNVIPILRCHTGISRSHSETWVWSCLSLNLLTTCP